MKVNDAALDIIRRFEGFQAYPYRCPAGVWTIGYGSTHTPWGDPVTADTLPIGRAQALDWMRHHLTGTERAAARLIRVPVTENQFGAVVSLTYNIGSGNLKASTLRQKLNRQDYAGAAAEFPRWRRAGGKVLRGLVKRRAAERALFLAA